MKILRLIDRVFKPQIAYAHCDIPCGIYDPHEAQMAAHTIIRMTSLINEVKALSDKKIISQIARLTKVQVRVIWGDYFKPEHLAKYKKLHDLVFTIMKQASKVKQEVNIGEAQKLLESVQELAQIYWETKGRGTIRVKSGYPTEGELVLPR